MRHTKIALAALALVASTAAKAETTIYGALDLSVSKASATKTSVDGTGNWNGSIFGFKGSEDLDGGMKGFFNLEMGLNMSNGTQNNGGTTVSQILDNTAATSVFNRLANVGVSGDFGTVTIGQQLNQFVAGSLGSNLNANQSFYVPMLLVAGGGGLTFGGDGVNNGGFFQPNLITYGTPSIGGLSAAVQTQIQGNKNANGTASRDQDKMVSGSATYAAGPVTVTGAYLSRELTSKAMSLGATYNMGEITLNARYFKFDTDPATTTINTYNVGASYALNANNSVSLQYVKNNQTNAQSIVNLGLQHNLSKNTYLYATASQGKNGGSTLYSQQHDGMPATTGSTTGYAVGIVKGF